MMTGPIRRATSGLALVLVAAGCFRYETVGALPQTTRLPRDLRVTTYRGEVALLTTSEMVADTIFGYRAGSPNRLTIPLAHVDLIEVKKFSMMDSLLMVAIAAGVAAYLIGSVSGGLFPSSGPAPGAPGR